MLWIGLWLAKISAVVFNKAIHDTFYSLKKVKIDSKDMILIYLRGSGK